MLLNVMIIFKEAAILYWTQWFYTVFSFFFYGKYISENCTNGNKKRLPKIHDIFDVVTN